MNRCKVCGEKLESPNADFCTAHSEMHFGNPGEVEEARLYYNLTTAQAYVNSVRRCKDCIACGVTMCQFHMRISQEIHYEDLPGDVT
jgi:hypothetical protein